MAKNFTNPFRPGAGHRPPYLAGRSKETREFRRLLKQDVILDNLVLTGLRGVGKTVLLDALKPIAIQEKWGWVGTDLSESSSISEGNMVLRLLTDLAVVTGAIPVAERLPLGFGAEAGKMPVNLDFSVLRGVYEATPGLPSDKLKRVLELVWDALRTTGHQGIVFAYDEAQNLSDHAVKEQFPLSLLLDVFQSIQKKSIPFMLVLVGLPTLFPKLVEARAYSERMFRVVFLDKLSAMDARDAILKPIQDAKCPVALNEPSSLAKNARVAPSPSEGPQDKERRGCVLTEKYVDEPRRSHRVPQPGDCSGVFQRAATVDLIIDLSGGYPYFIQFICREAYDAFLQGRNSAPVEEITRKLDSDFFAGRWAKATDRQRELLMVAAHLDTSDTEFTVQEISEKSKELLASPFSPSHINQMLVALANAGLIYKNRHGKYSFAVPLLNRFILRQENESM